MNITFTSVKWKNFLSYGNSFTEYKFKRGMDIITGKNGTGKCLRKNTVITVQTENKDIEATLKDYIEKFRTNKN